MKNRLALLMSAILWLGACAPAPEDRSEEEIAAEPVHIVSTTGMIHDAVLNVGGERVEAEALMGPGVDPHLHKASPDEISLIENSHVIFYNGFELEARIIEIFEKMAERGHPAAAVAEAVPESERLAEEMGKAVDPHVWGDPSLWVHAVERVAEMLTDYDPLNAEIYEQNAEAYVLELQALDSEIEDMLSAVPEDKRVLVTAHDAFKYFGERYGFEVLGIQGISTATAAGAGDIRNLADLITDREIPAIFVEASVPPATIESLQEAVRSRGWQVEVGGELYSDSLGSPGTPAETYIGMMRSNARTIAEALS
ncbi:MAG: metal ABC transporter solute-binding protein, Zn/Mn family [Fimbriimonadaceae bacterium]